VVKVLATHPDLAVQRLDDPHVGLFGVSGEQDMPDLEAG
jgi:hypothetical protein